ncbi:MAG: DUF2961 domain-containing protein [Planctomycetes bacterium]|nr:DUF2961 domain-containing protein [Planctomycetota bacterium]
MWLRSLWIALLAAALRAQDQARTLETVDFASLVREARDLSRLARAPRMPYRVLQWSSSDPRTKGPDDPHWFGANDGEGGSSVPSVLETIQSAEGNGIGEYTLGELIGSGVIVRTWSSGMNGRLRVIVDGQILFDGDADAFLRRRASTFLAFSGVDDDPQHPIHVFEQGDADYLPLPFARSLRIEWSGDPRLPHPYQVQIRQYLGRTWVQAFRFEDLRNAADELVRSARELRDPELMEIPDSRRELHDELVVPPGREASLEHVVAPGSTGDAITALRIQVDGTDPQRLAATLRGVLLRIAFDGSERPQVEAPLGDFFGSGPGLIPYAGLPITVQDDGWMVCRFPMPFHSRARVSFVNRTANPVSLVCERAVDAMRFDADTFHFRARWRSDRDLHVAEGESPFEVPLVLLRGSGRFVGCTMQVAHAFGGSTPAGDGWDAGDDKLFVDDAREPAIRGTGTADFFNLGSGQRDGFAAPYCGMPLCTGPGRAGFVSLHRFAILDDVPFDSAFGAWFEIAPREPMMGFGQARLAYVYARPGALDDHVPPTRADLELQPLEPSVLAGPSPGATWWRLGVPALHARVNGSEPPFVDEPLAAQGRVLAWSARSGDVLALRVPLSAVGVHELRLALAHRPDAARVRARIGGEAGALDGESALELRTTRRSSLRLHTLLDRRIARGELLVELIAESDGLVALDHVWVGLRRLQLDGCAEGEAMAVADASPGLAVSVRDVPGPQFSGGRILWGEAARSGDFVVLRASGLAPGRHRVALRLAASESGGRWRIAVPGSEQGVEVELRAPRLELAPVVDLGVADVGAGGLLEVRFELVAAEPATRAPSLGVDGLVLAPAN